MPPTCSLVRVPRGCLTEKPMIPSPDFCFVDMSDMLLLSDKPRRLTILADQDWSSQQNALFIQFLKPLFICYSREFHLRTRPKIDRCCHSILRFITMTRCKQSVSQENCTVYTNFTAQLTLCLCYDTRQQKHVYENKSLLSVRKMVDLILCCIFPDRASLEECFSHRCSTNWPATTT